MGSKNGFRLDNRLQFTEGGWLLFILAKLSSAPKLSPGYVDVCQSAHSPDIVFRHAGFPGMKPSNCPSSTKKEVYIYLVK